MTDQNEDVGNPDEASCTRLPCGSGCSGELQQVDLYYETGNFRATRIHCQKYRDLVSQGYILQ